MSLKSCRKSNGPDKLTSAGNISNDSSVLAMSFSRNKSSGESYCPAGVGPFSPAFKVLWELSLNPFMHQILQQNLITVFFHIWHEPFLFSDFSQFTFYWIHFHFTSTSKYNYFSMPANNAIFSRMLFSWLCLSPIIPASHLFHSMFFNSIVKYVLQSSYIILHIHQVQRWYFIIFDWLQSWINHIP